MIWVQLKVLISEEKSRYVGAHGLSDYAKLKDFLGEDRKSDKMLNIPSAEGTFIFSFSAFVFLFLKNK